jgi:hypothetical protein
MCSHADHATEMDKYEIAFQSNEYIEIDIKED